jgi:glycolate dehydrogenase iron-sulfur subunit
LAKTPDPKSDESCLTKIPDERFLDCMHCGLCLQACPTYLETGDENQSPRGRIFLLRAIAEGRLDFPTGSPAGAVAASLDLCLDCRACESACPSGVPYSRLIEPFRVSQHQKTVANGADTRSRLHHWLHDQLLPNRHRLKWVLVPVRLAQKTGLDRVAKNLGLKKLLPLSLRRMAEQLPQLQPAEKPLAEILPAVGVKRARVGLFLGCAAEAMFPGTNRSTARVLQANGCEVVVPKLQNCCGAIAYHEGKADQALHFLQQNADAFLHLNLDAIVVNAAGCGSLLKQAKVLARENAPERSDLQSRLGQLAELIRDYSEFLVELGPVPPQALAAPTLSQAKLAAPAPTFLAVYDDACHLLHGQGIRAAPRQLLEMVPGLELLPLEESDLCCGAAGSYCLTQPEMSQNLGQRKARNIQKSGAQAVITANVGCAIQIQNALLAIGHPLPVWHPAELLDRLYREQL